MRTNYPLTLSVEDLGEALGLTAQTVASVGAGRVCAMMERALEQLVEGYWKAAPEHGLWDGWMCCRLPSVISFVD